LKKLTGHADLNTTMRCHRSDERTNLGTPRRL